MAEWFRAPDFNEVTLVQIPLLPLAGVVLGKCLVQLLLANWSASPGWDSSICCFHLFVYLFHCP